MINPYKIPCKQCLKYAICVGQRSITCDEVQTYFNNVHDYIKMEMKIHKESNHNLVERNKAWDKAWEIMFHDLPNVKALCLNTVRQQMPNSTNPHYYQV